MVSYQGDTKYIGHEMISVAFDIGTTNSAASYTYLYPGDFARVRMVNRWPGQPESVGSSKIPTLISYRDGQCKACGAEALGYVDDSEYETAKWFKLHLHPSSMTISNQPPPYGSVDVPALGEFETPPLPSLVTIEQIYVDFIKYLMQNVRSSFEQSIPNGAAIWRRLRDSLVVILTTPNGWDFTQQHVLRRAAMTAGVVSEEKAYDLLEFVTEGEASVHYALAYSQSTSWLAADSIFAVIDAGGSTVDSTLYECKSTEPKILLEEVCPSECIQAGGVFVDRAAEILLRRRLMESPFGDDECITDMISAFESRTKRLFDGIQPFYTVDFGSSRDNDRANGIIKGKLSLSREEVSSTFEDVIKRTMSSCLDLLGGRKVKYLLLVGGLGESAYLQKRLTELFQSQGVGLVTVEEPAKKAAAEGAMIWYIKQSVSARVARTTLGTIPYALYDASDPEHAVRQALVFMNPQGRKSLPGRFDVLIAKGTKMQGDFTLVTEYAASYSHASRFASVKTFTIYAWDGEGIPKWANEVDGRTLPQMRPLCKLRADLSGLRKSLKPRYSLGRTYYETDIQVAIRLGGTQLQAQVQWMEGGNLCEGPVSILPNATL